MAEIIEFKKSDKDRQPPAASSSGRTPGFELGNSGSNPEAASKHFPIDTPEKDILDAMEKKLLFSMDVNIKNIVHGTPEERAKADAARIQKKLEAKSRF